MSEKLINYTPKQASMDAKANTNIDKHIDLINPVLEKIKECAMRGGRTIDLNEYNNKDRIIISVFLKDLGWNVFQLNKKETIIYITW